MAELRAVVPFLSPPVNAVGISFGAGFGVATTLETMLQMISERIRLSLRFKFIFNSLLILVPVVVLLIINYQRAYEIQRNHILADQLRVAQVVSVVVDDAFDQTTALGRTYATDPVILSFDPALINEYLARLAPIYPQYDTAVDVFDINGNLVGSSGGPRVANVADREWFQALLRGEREPIVTGVLISRVTGRPIAPVAVPIVDNEGKLLGAVGSALSLERFPESLQIVQRAPEQQIFLADRTGRLAFHTARAELTWEERDVSGYPPVQVALQGQTYIAERAPGIFDGERMIVAIPTSKYGWVVGVSVPTELALAPVRESAQSAALIFAAIVIFTIALALAVSEFLLQPLKRLADAAVALGKGQMERRVEIRTGDELERLANAFNNMADEMQRALRLREEFLSVASHELRTPLTVIKGYSQWALTKEEAEEKRKVLLTIVKQVDRISELLDEMLTVSELQAGRMELHRERIDLDVLVRDVVNRMQAITERHRLLVQSKGPVMVQADRNQIDLVLTNLIDNAIRYSPSGGDVEISVDQMDCNAIVTVVDHGMGIPEDKLQHVFEPFFQIQPAIAGFGGMGLGLFITKQIIERHGGKIWFESEEGLGSKFFFTLPLA